MSLLLADGGVGDVGLGGGAEAAEPVGREHLGGIRQLGGQPVRGGVLGVDQVMGVLVPEQIGSTGRAVEQGSAGEHRHRLTAGGQGVGEVAERVPGCGQGPHHHRRAHGHVLIVGDRGPVVGDLVGGVDEVRGAGALGQGQAAGDVVVVDVGLEHVADPHAFGGGQVEDAVDVALRVDHERHLPVVDEVAAVAQGRGLDRDDRRGLLGRAAGCGAGHLGVVVIVVTSSSGRRCRPGGCWRSRRRCRR